MSSSADDVDVTVLALHREFSAIVRQALGSMSPQLLDHSTKALCHAWLGRLIESEPQRPPDIRSRNALAAMILSIVLERGLDERVKKFPEGLTLPSVSYMDYFKAVSAIKDAIHVEPVKELDVRAKQRYPSSKNGKIYGSDSSASLTRKVNAFDRRLNFPSPALSHIQTPNTSQPHQSAKPMSYNDLVNATNIAGILAAIRNPKSLTANRPSALTRSRTSSDTKNRSRTSSSPKHSPSTNFHILKYDQVDEGTQTSSKTFRRPNRPISAKPGNTNSESEIGNFQIPKRNSWDDISDKIKRLMNNLETY